jgi:hypothetical protein
METKMKRKKWMQAILVCIFGACMASGASANIALDLDPMEGDQALATKAVKAGDTVEIELLAKKGALDIAGFEVVVQFDSQKFAFQSYQKGGLMTSAIALPAATTADGIKISAGFLGGKSAKDSGSLGFLVFTVSPNFGEGGKIALTQGSFGTAGATVQFPLDSAVMLQGASSAGTTTAHGQDMGGPMGNNPQGQGGMGGPTGNNPQGRGGMGGPTGNNPQGQGGPGGPMGNNPRGQGGMGGPTGNNPQGQGGPGGPMGNDPRGQGGPGGPMGNDPRGQGGPGGPMGNNPQGQGGPGGPMGNNPQGQGALINMLPPTLQVAYKETNRTHLKGELDGLISKRQTFELTGKYLATANSQEKDAIRTVLMGFNLGMHQDGPNQGPPPTQVQDLLNSMIQNNNRRIQELTQKLNDMR